MKIKIGLLNMLDRRRLITFFVIAALLCQDMAMAIAPRSIFEAPVGTKESLPLLQALGRCLDRLLEGKTIEPDPYIVEYISSHKVGQRDAVIELGFIETVIFLQRWHSGKYTSIDEKDLSSVVEKIVNTWLEVYMGIAIKLKKDQNDPVTIHYASWYNTCKVKDILIRDRKCFISLRILNRDMGIIVPIREEGEIQPALSKDSMFNEVRYDRYLVLKLKALLKTKEDPDLHGCIQEMIDTLGRETTVNVLMKNKDFLELSEEQIGELIGVRKDLGLIGPYPKAELLEYTPGVQPSIHITGEIDKKILDETIAVLEDTARKIPRLKETLIDSVIEKIRRGKVLFGKHFTKACMAVETVGEEGGEHLILVNRYLEDALGLDSGDIDARSLRGIFLAGILLGQEAQIYLRKNKGINWQEPDFNTAFIAQAAELQIMHLNRNNLEYMRRYIVYLESLTTNSWGDVNLADTLTLHSAILSEGVDYQFIEARGDAILMYRDILKYLAQIEFSDESCRRINIFRIQELIKDMGLAVVLNLSDIPPPDVPYVSVQYRKRVDREGLIPDEELISLVKGIHIPVVYGNEHILKGIGDLVDNGIFSGIVIEVEPSIRKVKIRLDTRSMQVFVTVPELRDKARWPEYCETVEIIPGEKVHVVQTGIYGDFLRESAMDQRAIEEAHEVFQKGDIDRAEKIIRRRLSINPNGFGLYSYLLQLILPNTGRVREAMELLHSVLKDHRLYRRSRRELLLRFIGIGLSIEALRNFSGDCNSVADMLHLADIAKRYVDIHLEEMDIEEVQTRAKREGYIAKLIIETDKSKRELINYQIQMLDNALAESGNEEKRIKESFNSIASGIAFLCFDRSYFTAVDYWLDQAFKEDNERRQKRLLTKAFLSFCGGQPLSEDELKDLFRLYNDRQKGNPIDCANLASRAFHLLILWRYAYPERRELLEEAEKTYEQYRAIYYISTMHIPQYAYYLGLVKYYLGKTDEAFSYLGEFLTTAPKFLVTRMACLEGKSIYTKLEREIREKEGPKAFKDRKIRQISAPVIVDLVENYFDPFINTGFNEFKDEDRNRFVYIYLKLLRESGKLEKAYRQAILWLEALPDVDIDMVEELVRIGVQLKKNDEVMELLQERLASLRDKDIILDYAKVIALKESNDYINALRILNSLTLVRQEGVEDKIFANIFTERADIYMRMGQFMAAKKEWEYIKRMGWRAESVCQKNIIFAERSEAYNAQLVKSVFEDVEQNPDLVIKRMDDILERYPHYRLALRLKNTMRSYQGNFSDVEKEYGQLLELYPDDIGFRLDLAFCSLMAENPKAVDYYREYQRLGGDIESVRDQVASAYFNAKMWQEAIAHIKACIKKGVKSIDLDIKLAFSYVKLEMWEESTSVLLKDFPEEKAAAQSKTTRGQVSELFLACGFAILKQDKPDWERIEILRKRAAVWGEGIGMDEKIKKLEDEIEYLKLLEAEKETVREREKTIQLLMRTLRNRVRELREEVMEEDRIIKLQEEIERLLAKIEELKDETTINEIREIRKGLPRYIESARERIRERNTAIDRLKEEIRTAIDDLTSGKEVPEVTINNLFSRARVLGIQERLLDDLKAAWELAVEEKKRKERERRLRELEVKVEQLEGEVNRMIEELQDLPPGMDPAPILERYCDTLKGFTEKDLPEEIAGRLKALDNRFRGRYGQAKGRKKLKFKQAFDAEIEVALREMENIDIPRDGGIIERRGVIRRQLLRLIDRVIEKYSRIPGFEIKQSAKRRTRRLAEEKIANVINRLEREMESREEIEEKRRTEEDKARIDELFKRKKIIQEIIDEWAGMIREEIAEKARSEVDFDLIRLKGRQLAERLEGEGIYLTYEEAFHIQNEMFRVINPNSLKARYSWEAIWPVLQAISMNERDKDRAEKEVEDCFKRPEIDDIDRRIFEILDRDGIIEKIQTANNDVRDTRNWCIRLGSTSELMRLGIIKDPVEVIMVQIHLLRGIYTDDPENRIDPKSPDYAEEVAETIARKFSKGDKQDFLYDLERTRMKLTPRKEPHGKREPDEEEGTSWIRQNLGMHRFLTPDETRSLVLLAQKGNPVAMNVLQQAHAVTVLTEAVNLAKRTSSHAKLGDYLNYGFLGFSQGVIRYGYRIGDNGEYIREERWLRLHLINPNFLTWIRMPIKKVIERSAKKEAGDVAEAFWIEEEKRLLGKARGQVYRDINIIRGLSELIEKRGEEICLTKKNISPDTIQRIALSTGLKPLEVLALLVGCPVSDLNKNAQGLLAKRLRSKLKSLELIAQFVGGEPTPGMVEGFELEEIRAHMDKVFEGILKEKNVDWRKQGSHNLGPLINVLLVREDLSTLWWLERRGLDEKDLLGIYTEYFRKIYNHVLEGEDDIAPIVEHMIEISPSQQLNIDAKGVREIKSLDAPVSEDSDTERSETEDLAGFVDQRSPLEELETQERPTVLDIRGLSPEAFMAAREKVIAMLDRLGERLMGERRKELENLRPNWEKESARLEEHRSLVAEIEVKLERARGEKLKELEPINRRIEEIEKRHEARKRGLLERQEREKMGLLERQTHELESSRDGKGLETEERRAHWLELQREVVERINEREAEIEMAYKKALRAIEEEARLKSNVALKFFDEAKDELDVEIVQLRSRHNVEISSAQSKEAPKEMEGFYPPIHPGIKAEMGTIKFDKEFWLWLLDKMNGQSPEELLSELDGEKAEILRQLIEKGMSFELHPVELICTVFIPLCLDSRIWDLIDGEGLELRALLYKLRRQKEPEIDVEQLVILNRIVERYKRFLERPAQLIVDLEAIRERQRKELETAQRKVDVKKRLARIRYNGILRQIEIDRGNAIREAEERHEIILAALAEERKAGIREAGRQHKEWCRLSGKGRLTEKHREEMEEMERRHADEVEALNNECEAEIAPTRQRYNELLAELDRGIGQELEELAEAIRYEEKLEKDMRHDLDKVSLAVQEERQALLDGNTEEDRQLKEKHQTEWEEYVDTVNSLGIGMLLLNGYPQWTEEIVRKGLKALRGMEDFLKDVDTIAVRQAEDERQLKEKHRGQVEELDRKETERKRHLEEKQEELSSMRGRLFSSERYLSQWLEEELILLRKLERDFEPLDRRYQELEQRLKNLARAKSMYLDYIGLSIEALKSDGPMTLEIIGNDPRYRKPDGTPLTRERVRQILKKLQLQLLVFDDLDDMDLELVEPYGRPKEIEKLSSQLGMDSFTGEKADDLGRFFISRKELLRLLRSIIEDTKVAGACTDIIRLFIIKNQMRDVDLYKIVAEMAQQLIDALEPDEVTLLCFRECIGEMRIRLLREGQMGSPEKNLIPYTENALIDLERRFREDYNPTDDFPYFPTTDKAWLSRDEIIRLGLTVGTNPKARELLNRFIEVQLGMYPDSGIEEVVKELAGTETQPDSPGLIGKYVLLSKVIFSDGHIQFKAYRLDDPKKARLDIRIVAEKIEPVLFNNFRRTGIQEIDTALERFIAGFKGGAYLLSSNQYGIDGIGTNDTLAILESMSHNAIALFHELAHVAGVDVTRYINTDPGDLDLYLRSVGKGIPQMRQHYALRFFQRQQWSVDDKALTRLIKIERLKTRPKSEEKIKIAGLLGLDIRPIRNRLLGIQYVGHDMAVKEIVNPHNEHKVAVYGCSGADWSNLILSTNADESYFIDTTPLDVEELQRLLDSKWDEIEDSDYLENGKYLVGYVTSDLHGMPYLETKMLIELKGMGVEKDSIKITQNADDSVTITFDWAYLGQRFKRYSITYIKADISNPAGYPEGLRKVLGKGIDIYYQRASLIIPEQYDKFIALLGSSIKEGGYMLTDDISLCPDPIYVDPNDFLDGASGLNFTKRGEISSAELKHWEGFIKEGSTLSKNFWYGKFVIIRQRKGVFSEGRFRQVFGKDIEFTKGLLLGISEERVYEIRYDASRLSGSQQDVLRTYIDILGKKLNIEAKPFKGAERDYVIKVICKDDKEKVFGEGGVDVEGEGNLEECPLRIIGMLNIAFAASNIIDEPSVDDPLIRFIQYQYKAITGKELSEGAEVRKIILSVPERIDIEEAERLNQLARELLVAA